MAAQYTYHYDANGNIISRTEYSGDGIQTAQTLYEYDKKGNLICETYLGSDGTTVFKHTYEYDKNNNMTASSGSMFDYKYEYNSKGILTRMIWYTPNGKKQYETKYKNPTVIYLPE